MAIVMVALNRRANGSWTARKAIPEDVREAYGKREEKRTWPAALSSVEAKAEFTAWLSDIETRIANLRNAAAGKPHNLTQKHCLALAGEWYRELVARFEDDPGSPLDWEEELWSLKPEDEETYNDYLRGVPWDRYGERFAPNSFVVGERDRLLRHHRLCLNEQSSARLLHEMHSLYADLCLLMVRRANGDYSPDPLAESLPRLEDAAPRAKPAAVSLQDLFDGYCAEQRPAPATVKAWRRQLKHFIEHLGHDDASRVTPDDVIAWKDRLATEPTHRGTLRSAKTINDTYLSAVRAVFAWGVENRRIPTNPALGIKARGPKPPKLRDKALSAREARIILKAALEPPKEKLSEPHALARRWVPWICAYTGARVNEITQLRAEDIRQEDGVWVIHITPEAGSVKTNEARSVPIHPHLIEQGLLKVVQRREGPLFYDPARHRGGSDGNPQYKKVGERLAKWVRSLGVSDPNVQPNHGWRHRFKTVARSAGLDREARELITGHAPRTEGEEYGHWEPVALLREIEKLPWYEAD